MLAIYYAKEDEREKPTVSAAWLDSIASVSGFGTGLELLLLDIGVELAVRFSVYASLTDG